MENIAEADVVIIGAGPAGMQAAIHAARKKVRVVVLGKPGHSSLDAAHVENYCCMQGVSQGREMLADGRRQAERFGAVFSGGGYLGKLCKTSDYPLS
jgi:thioredoxin reductase (NADPH)